VSEPKGIVADLHCHAWSQFSKVGPDGVNSRLTIILDELERAAAEVRRLGGFHLIIAGDLFHVRGSIDPEVFNPVHERIKRILRTGVSIIAIAGNHDLKGKETTELGNAMQTLGALSGFAVVTEPKVIGDVLYVPWQSTPAKLLEAIERFIYDNSLDSDVLAALDLVIHAPVNDVLVSLPDHGLDPDKLAGLGFRRVFSGHYHNFKQVRPNVYSIGATTHQTWGDVGSKAGFLIIDDEKVNWNASRAPSFVDIDETTDAEEIPLIVDGNYVRVRGLKLTNEQIKKMDLELRDCGALGVSFQVAREVVSARTGAPTKITSLEESITKYINDTIGNVEVLGACKDILSAVTSVAS